MLQFPTRDPVRLAEDGQALLIGRDNPVTLAGLGSACVESITLRQGALSVPLKWKASADEAVALTLPLQNVQAGELTLEVRQYGLAESSKVLLRADQPVVAPAVPVEPGT